MKKSNTHKERLYEVAEKYIFERGVAGWNMDDLASATGVTKRTLYKMISSKEALIEEILISSIRDVQEKINRIITGEADYFRAAQAIMEEFPALVHQMNSRTISDIYLQYPRIEAAVIDRRNELTAKLIDFFKRGIEEGYLRKDQSPEFILQLYQALVMYFIKSSISSDELSEQLGKAFEVLLNGIKANH